MNTTNLAHDHYQNEERWLSYWSQIKSVMDQKPETVLEIGPGFGAVTWYLRTQGVKVTTLDYDPAMKPDVVGSADALPFTDKSFDVVLASEIFEHLPWEKFSKCLSEARRVAKKRVVVSLPHWGWTFIAVWKIPMLKIKEWIWKLDGLKANPPGGEHFWEIGRKGWPLSRVRSEMEKAGFKIEKCFMRPLAPYHHFFILTPL